VKTSATPSFTGINITGTASIASIGMGNDSSVIKFDDNNGQTRTGYYSAKDGLFLQGDSNSTDNVVVKTGYLDITQNVYIDKKVGINKFSIEYNSTDDCLDFVYTP
jgi:hypothetical protein